MKTTSTNSGKTVAILAYIAFIGWIIAFVINNGNRTELGSFHIRQSLGIICLGVLVSIVSKILFVSFVSGILALGLFVLWLLGIISAIKGEMKPIPLLGEQFQQWFRGI